MAEFTEVTVQLDHVTKKFGGGVVAVDDVDLSVSSGEFFSLLGPSGCGKTTSLRMLGGFVVPDTGRILLDGRDVTKTPPYRRDVNTVFQSYALFSHLSVANNVAFGLKRRKVAKNEIRRRVGEMLELVDLSGRADARPAELSGGQRQRVALARSLVNMPKVLLLDEPLGALDLKLRRAMQVELKRIQREVGITFVYVTHDQEEALTMSDRIGVMNAGRLEQVGTPTDIYETPASAFVAGFIGNTNLLDGTCTSDGVKLSNGQLLAVPLGSSHVVEVGRPAVVSLRPERVLIDPDPLPVGTAVRGVVREATYLGSSTHYTIACSGGLVLSALEPNAHGLHTTRSPGTEVTAAWRVEDAVVLPRNGKGTDE